jgi:SpoVK/Ycf46/Vps4 family AAA+-type ATPase
MDALYLGDKMKKSIQGHVDFSQNNNVFTANPKIASNAAALPPGAYTLAFDPGTGKLYFHQFEIASDKLLDLPTKEFHQVVDQIEVFLRPETRAKFEEYGYLYKRSALLHGSWGTGKTCMLARIAAYAQAKGAVVLFNPHPDLVTKALQQIDDIQPQTTVVVLFEELDKLMQKHEGSMLSILDGETQKNNVIYLATTNFINQIPPRILRPGRFSNVVEVGFPDAHCREYYLEHKLGKDGTDIRAWVKKTEGFSIDELKEVVLAVKCLSQPLDEVLERIKASRDQQISNKSMYDEDDGDDDEIVTSLAALKKFYRDASLFGVSTKR